MALTRAFKLVPNAHIQDLVSKLPPWLDGELIAGTYNETQSAVMSFAGRPDFRYCIFDWAIDGPNVPYWYRVQRLQEFSWPDFVELVLPVELSDQEAFDAQYAAYMEQGFEGIMTRQPGGPYKYGRSTPTEQLLMKHKTTEDSEAVILSLEEQYQNNNPIEYNTFGKARRPGGRECHTPKGTLGSFICRDVHTGGDVNIGTGMDDELRQHVWDNQQLYIGRILKYEFQRCGAKDRPRFPRFVGFRDATDM